jgi:hypothetical protein
MLVYVGLLRWNPLIALTGGSLVYVLVFASTEGRRLTSFVRRIVRKPEADTIGIATSA